MRERLIELIESARYWGANTPSEIADRLISNGVTVDGISVGQIIYRYDCDDMVHPVKEYVCTDIEYDCFIVQNKTNFSDKRRLKYSSLQSNCFYFSKEYAEEMVKLNIKNTAKYVVKNGKKLSVYSTIGREGFLISVANILCEDKLYFVVFRKDEHGNEKIHLCSQVRIDGGE